MSEPALFVFVQNGSKQYFYDRWAGSIFFRELMWGPQWLRDWMSDEHELEGFTDEISAGAVVDMDLKRLVWFGSDAVLDHPRMDPIVDKLLAAAWPDFQIGYAVDGVADLAAAAGEPDADDYEAADPWEGFASSLLVAGSTDPSDPGIIEFRGRPEYQDLDEQIAEGDPRFWITLVSETGSVGHRHVNQLPKDLILGDATALGLLERTLCDEVPREILCRGGLWIDQPRREIGFWGSRCFRNLVPIVENSWSDWDVVFTDQGYRSQTALSGPEGEPFSETQALHRIAPILLSTERFDVGTMFRTIGDQLKQTGRTLAGCLTVFFAIWALIFGLVTGNWKAAGMAVVVMVLTVAIVFKFLEHRVRKKFDSFQAAKREEDGETDRAPTPGPIDPSERRKALSTLLAAAEMAPLDEIEKTHSQ